MLHSLNDSHFKTFNDLGKVVLKRLERILNNKDMEPPVDVVTPVFDRYDKEHSIKSSERQLRGTTDTKSKATEMYPITDDFSSLAQIRQVLRHS